MHLGSCPVNTICMMGGREILACVPGNPYWDTVPRPTQRRAIITRHGNNQLVKQEEAARCAPMCGERELEDVWRLRKKQQAGVSIYYIQEEPFWGWIMSCESCPLCLNETEIYIYIFNMKTCIQKTIYQSINVWTTVQMFEVSIFFVSIYK